MPPARSRGSVTLELIIAFAVLSLVLTSIILLEGSENSTALIRESDEYAFAVDALQDARHTNYLLLVSTTTLAQRNGISYTVSQTRRDLTPCLRRVQTVASTIKDSVSFYGLIGDEHGMRALGGDCETSATLESWIRAEPAGSMIIAGASGTAIDVLTGVAYVGLTEPPYVAIADATTDQFMAFQNGFTLSAAPNALDAAFVNGRRYVFAALNATSSQLAIIDVTDSANPTTIATRSLAGVNSSGANPEARHILYDDRRAYVTTWRITGAQPELHVFDVSDPAQPNELGSANIETDVKGLAVRDTQQQGGLRRYFFAATTHAQKELAVYDVTNPYAMSPEPITAVNFGTDTSGTNGTALALVGTTLYFGRASNTGGPEFYAYDVSGVPDVPPTLIGSGEVGSKDVSGITVSGTLAFITATLGTPSTRRLEVWNIADPAHPMRAAQIPLPGVAPGGIDFAGDRLFTTGSTTLEVFKSN